MQSVRKLSQGTKDESEGVGTKNARAHCRLHSRKSRRCSFGRLCTKPWMIQSLFETPIEIPIDKNAENQCDETDEESECAGGHTDDPDIALALQSVANGFTG